MRYGWWALLLWGVASVSQAQQATVVCPNRWVGPEALAAREVRRYVYLRTGELLPIAAGFGAGDAIVLAQKDDPFLKSAGADASWADLGPQEYVLKTVARPEGRALFVVGGSGPAVLYGAYRLAERLGARFYLHGDVVPDTRAPFALPELDERRTPLFGLRGIQPFHDFPEGPDWWNTDDYKAIVAQLPKLGMNFIGLHTYPIVEPTVWIGAPEDAGKGGRVSFAYPARYYNTALKVGWGLTPMKTSDYACGGAMLFDRDDYGADVMRGLTPEPSAPGAAVEMFERVGAMFNEAFSLANRLGVKTCIGTETPLVVPEPVRARMGERVNVSDLYEGMFRRIMATHPLDYYWFWTPEGWTWEGTRQEQVEATVEDLRTAMAAARRVGAPFTLATSGWVLGPQTDRAYLDKVLPKDIAVSCINRQVGFDPVERAFAEISGREKWAIPWLEDDPAMTSVQLWAGRMRRDARDALDYGCTGLLGIHWRTRSLGPNVAALAQAAWDQDGWSERKLERSGVVGGVAVGDPKAAIEGTDDDPLYATVRYSLTAYRLLVPDGRYRVTLKLCEVHHTEPGKRVFGVKLEGKQVEEHVDLFQRAGKNRAVDLSFENVEVSDGVLDVEFTGEVEYPLVAGLEVQGDGVDIKIDCGGAGYGEYAADLEPISGHLPADDFYADWARHEFGPEAGEAAAAILARMDGRLPRPSDWVGGPGGYRPDERPWDRVAEEYRFVDEFAALEPRVSGPGNRERFRYWLENFEFLRAMGRVRCVWGEYRAAVEHAKASIDEAGKVAVARGSALPLRIALARAVEEAYGHLLATVNTSGEMGTVCNLEQHTFPAMLAADGAELEALLGEPLPDEAQLRRSYAGAPRLFVPTVRGVVQPDEALTVRAVLLDDAPARRVVLCWRPLGEGEFRKTSMKNVARGTFAATLPPDELGGDIEYYVDAVAAGGQGLRWPATAPDVNQTVVRVQL